MNFEVRALAVNVLANHFYATFCQLVASHVSAAEGLDVDRLLELMSSMCNVWDGAQSDPVLIDIFTNGANGNSRHKTLLAALVCSNATTVEVGGKRVFERRQGDWYYVGD